MEKFTGASAGERIDAGKQLRQKVDRDAQAHLNPKGRDFDPVVVLRAAVARRVPDLLPVKYARMKVSPFAFFRGTAFLMAADMARLPNSGIEVQICGDAHVQNMGSFAAPDGKLVFDINDFDETVRAPWECDVKRMAASVVLAGRESGHDAEGCHAAAAALVESYCKSIRAMAEMPVLEAVRFVVHRDSRVAPIHAALTQSERARPREILKKLTERDKRGNPRFRNQPPVISRVTGETAKSVLDSLAAYRETLLPERRAFFDRFHPVDVGFKVVGTGSVGLRDYVVLFEGNGPRDPIFLQVKQEIESAWSPQVVSESPSGERHEGRRVALGQRAMQPLSDLFLGWTKIGSNGYLVRQLNDHKGSIDLDNLKRAGLTHLARVAGELMARGHARTGDACLISGYCGSPAKTAKAFANFAIEYADQATADYKAFLAALKKGALKAPAKTKPAAAS